MTDLKIVELKSPTTEWERGVQEDTVQALERMLTDAKAGLLDGVAICAITKGGGTIISVSQHNQHSALVGAATILVARLLRTADPVAEE